MASFQHSFGETWPQAFKQPQVRHWMHETQDSKTIVLVERQHLIADETVKENSEMCYHVVHTYKLFHA